MEQELSELIREKQRSYVLVLLVPKAAPDAQAAQLHQGQRPCGGSQAQLRQGLHPPALHPPPPAARFMPQNTQQFKASPAPTEGHWPAALQLKPERRCHKVGWSLLPGNK